MVKVVAGTFPIGELASVGQPLSDNVPSFDIVCIEFMLVLVSLSLHLSYELLNE